jgi:hypothetical protein
LPSRVVIFLEGDESAVEEPDGEDDRRDDEDEEFWSLEVAVEEVERVGEEGHRCTPARLISDSIP